MATFTKLFEISMVASNRFGRSKSLIIKLFFFDFSPRSCFRCGGSSEKNAISDPDINAEHTSNKIIINILIATAGVNALKIFSARTIAGYNKGPFSGSSNCFCIAILRIQN